MSAALEDRRVWLGGGVAVGVLVVLAGWLLLLQPQLTATADTNTLTEDAQLQNSTLAAKVSALKSADRGIPTLVAGLRRTREQLPITSGLATFTDQLGTQAAAAGVTVTSIAVGAVSPAVAAVPVPAATAASGTGTGTSGISENAPATTTAGAGGPAGQLYQVQLTVITTGTLAQQRGFLTAVQAQGPRAALITSVQLAPATDPAAAAAAKPGASPPVASIDRSATMTTVLTIFVAPQTPANAKQLAAQLAAKPQR